MIFNLTSLRNILIVCLLFSVFFSCDKDEFQQPEDEIDIDQPNDPLPEVHIYTNGQTIVDEPKIEAMITTVELGEVTYSGKIGIEIRGASSQMFPKKSYGLETWDESGMDMDVALLGLPEEEDWILHGPYSDKSLMRNILLYDISRDMGRYASRCKFVLLKINNELKGVYVFMEKLKRDKNRLDIAKLRPEDNSGEELTGGYILKIDKTAGNNSGEGITEHNSFPSKYPANNSNDQSIINFQYEYPKATEITDAQKAYIQQYMSDFEDALKSSSFRDPDIGYRNYIDPDSFVDYFIMNELSNNVDGYRLSTYFHKDKNEKLNMGPVWDFNLAFGNADYCSGGSTGVWAYKFNDRCPGGPWSIPFWWERLLQDQYFVAKVKNRWNYLRSNILSNSAMEERIAAYLTILDEKNAVQNNFSTWPILGTYIWPNNYVGSTFDDEINYLTTWIDDRLKWLDTAIPQL